RRDPEVLPGRAVGPRPGPGERPQGRGRARGSRGHLTAGAAMPADPIEIELLNPTDRALVGEPLPLHLVCRCPADGPPAELRHIGSVNPAVAELDADLFERDLTLQPGEVYRCTVAARFLAPRLHPERLFYVQVGR